MTKAPFAKDAARRKARLSSDPKVLANWLGDDGAKDSQPDTSADAIRGLQQAVECETARSLGISAEEVWRYKCGKSKTMVLDCEGNWVKHSDYATLAAERDAPRNAQGYTYIGKNGKPVLARDLEDQRDALQAKLDDAMGALESVKSDLVVRDVDVGPYVWMRLCATIAKLKGANHE